MYPDSAPTPTAKIVALTVTAAVLVPFLFWLALVGIPAVVEFDQLHEALRGVFAG